MVVIQPKFEPDRKENFFLEQTLKIKVLTTVFFLAWLSVSACFSVSRQGSYVVVYKY